MIDQINSFHRINVFYIFSKYLLGTIQTNTYLLKFIIIFITTSI